MRFFVLDGCVGFGCMNFIRLELGLDKGVSIVFVLYEVDVFLVRSRGRVFRGFVVLRIMV